MLRFLAPIVVLLAGCACQTPEFTRPPTTGAPWETTYLLDADPTSVSLADLDSRAASLTAHYWEYAQVNGVLWPPWRTSSAVEHPDRWTNGGDTGIYTGQALAAFCFEYKATGTNEALFRAFRTLRGVYILTHATGTPGVIQRNSFPTSDAARFGFPGEMQHRIDKGFIGTGLGFADPLGGPPIPPQTYYTRGTKDQLTGMVLGLSAAWTVFDPATVPAAHVHYALLARHVIRQTTQDIYDHLIQHDWRIRAINSNTGEWDNDTSADHVDQLLRACLLGLVQHTGAANVQVEYDKEFDSFIDLSNTLAIADRFSNAQQYYAHNLRTSRALSLWLLEGATSDKGARIASYFNTNVWRFTKGHRSAWFAFTRAAMAGDQDAVDEGVYSLQSLSLKPVRMWSSPLHGQEHKPTIADVLAGCVNLYVLDPHLRKPEDYSTWQKEPWDTGPETDWDKEALGDISGIDFLLPYWLGKAFGIF